MTRAEIIRSVADEAGMSVEETEYMLVDMGFGEEDLVELWELGSEA